MRRLFVRYPHAFAVVLILGTMMVYVGGIRYYAEEAKKQVAYDKTRPACRLGRHARKTKTSKIQLFHERINHTDWPAPTEWSSLNVSALSVFAPSGSGGVAERSRLIRLAG